MTLSIEWLDYQKYVNDLSAKYGVYGTHRELPVLTNGILEELNEVQEAVYLAFTEPRNHDYKSMIMVEIGDTLAYVMILASRFSISAEDVIRAGQLNNASTEVALINAFKAAGVFKRIFRGDYIHELRDDFSFTALNALYTKESFHHTLTQALGNICYYLERIALEQNLCMDTIKSSNMGKGAYLATKTQGKSHFLETSQEI